MLTRQRTIVLAVLSALLAGCADDEPTGVDAAAAPPDAGLDAAIDADIDGAADAGADVEPDAPPPAPDAALDAAPDSAPDLAIDLAADAPRPGILSVPADDLDVMATEVMAGGVRAYLAVPSRVGSFAGLVLVPDERGLTEHLRDVARRFAKTGCVALAPDVGARTEPALLADLDAALTALGSQPQVGAGRTGAVGFGDGGARALRFAAANPKVRAVVAYYAPTPLDLKGIGAAVLGQYGEKDDAVNAGIADLERMVKEAGKPFEKHLYPAGHGFNDDTGPGYDEAAAVAAWPFTVGWMELYAN